MTLSTYIRKRRRSLGYAWQGLRTFWKTEPHARLHAIATVIAIAAGFLFKLNKNEWKWLLIAIFLVWITEILNTAIEKLADVVSPGYAVAIKQVKDMAAAAVLLSAVFAVVIALIIFLPKIISGS
ncbi:MAG: diacylglycerol kinase [Sphingobacteriales bacterium SCN 48-20]|jgi:diacylglycerol kinase|uniref:diacylglycerol kinase family protein n=1 Tax=Terrimonas ferruginea TaxID=249 RepID=UPI00086B7476|nr:diacylglycerol kinase family protein [Terrimonas ferruginea]MBN8782582.1 diacylglycerol kinase family protein [Terrimonas ferruginea]ODT93629.1 MAG: diacylglycerol kinase [Sphingobacteriales bacterium SCN 48-20]OJW43085.1 MAG: diacylglycerol kinase [Sphingobacteriales bacterium 48-107]